MTLLHRDIHPTTFWRSRGMFPSHITTKIQKTNTIAHQIAAQPSPKSSGKSGHDYSFAHK